VAQGNQTALKVTGDIAQAVTITTGIRDAGFVEILTGLVPGDQIVAKAGAFVRDGDRITPVPAKE
jgi:HlyD family secretion protein